MKQGWFHGPHGWRPRPSKANIPLKRAQPPRSSSARVPLVEHPPLLRCKAPDPSLSCVCPLMGSQHPPDGLFSPMEVRTDHLPMCTGPNGICSSGMILHIKSYALHGLISHRDHSNANHISSSILINICMKSLIDQSIAQRRYTYLLYKSEKRARHPIGLVSTK